jgi:hypothetical protein
MYKNRLVRCYLGASNQASRNEQPFTGLDDGDDLPLRHLAGVKPGDPVQRPFHIINTALNISQGSNLAWQERKAASFVLTPLYCGFSLAPTQGDRTPADRPRDDYCPTALYAARDGEEPTTWDGPRHSGRRESEHGICQRPARAFLLTMFNASRSLVPTRCRQVAPAEPAVRTAVFAAGTTGLSTKRGTSFTVRRRALREPGSTNWSGDAAR